MPPLSPSLQRLIAPDDELTEEELKQDEEEVKRLIEESERSQFIRNVETGLRTAAGSAKSLLSEVLGASVTAPSTLGSGAQGGQFFEPQEDLAQKQEIAEGAQKASREQFDRVNELSQRADMIDEIAGANKVIAQATRGAVSSLATAIPAAALGGGVGVIATFGALRANEAEKEADDAGLTGDDKLEYITKSAMIEMGVTSAFQGAGKVFGGGLAGFEGIGRASAAAKGGLSNALKSFGKSSLAELSEEEIIFFLDSYNQSISNVDPEAFTDERLREGAFQTAVTTFATMAGGQTLRTVQDKTLGAVDSLRTGLELTPAEQEDINKRVQSERIAAIDPENPSRSAFAEALGVGKNDIPQDLNSKAKRKERIEQEKAFIEAEDAQQLTPPEAQDDIQQVSEISEPTITETVDTAQAQEVAVEPVPDTGDVRDVAQTEQGRQEQAEVVGLTQEIETLEQQVEFIEQGLSDLGESPTDLELQRIDQQGELAGRIFELKSRRDVLSGVNQPSDVLTEAQQNIDEGNAFLNTRLNESELIEGEIQELERDIALREDIINEEESNIVPIRGRKQKTTPQSIKIQEESIAESRAKIEELSATLQQAQEIAPIDPTQAPTEAQQVIADTDVGVKPKRGRKAKKKVEPVEPEVPTVQDELSVLSEQEFEATDNIEFAQDPQGINYDEKIEGWVDLSADDQLDIVEQDYDVASQVIRERGDIRDPEAGFVPVGDIAKAISVKARRFTRQFKKNEPILKNLPEDETMRNAMKVAHARSDEKHILEGRTWRKKILDSLNRVHQHIPATTALGIDTKEDVSFFAPARELLSELPAGLEVAQRNTEERLDKILEPLIDDPEAFDLFSKTVLARDLFESNEIGDPRRFGAKDIETVEAWVKDLDRKVNLPENKKVKTALAQRKVENDKLRKEAQEEGILPEDADRDEYFRHNIKVFAITDAVQKKKTEGQGLPSFARARTTSSDVKDRAAEIQVEREAQGLDPLSRIDARKQATKELMAQGFEIDELPPIFDFNPDYLSPERDFNLSVEQAIHTKRTMDKIEKTYDKSEDFQETLTSRNADIKQRNKKIAKSNKSKKKGARAKKLIPELGIMDLVHESGDMTLWSPPPRSVLNPTLTLQDMIEDEIMGVILEDNPDGAENANEIMAIERSAPVWIIRKELAAQLDQVAKPADTTARGDMVRAITSDLKKWYLNNPRASFLYNVRNLFGDSEYTFAANPDTFKKMSSAYSDLLNARSGEKSEDYLEAVENRALSGSEVVADYFQGKEESKMREFATNPTPFAELTAYEQTAAVLTAPLKGVLKVKTLLEWPGMKVAGFREDVFRLAAYKSFKQQLTESQDTGKPVHYGASRKGDIDQIVLDLGIPAAAAKQANDMLLNYSELTVAGKVMRDFIQPFWGFKELNFKRTYRVLINAFTDPSATKEAKARAASLVAMRSASFSMLMAMRLASVSIGAQVWNHLFMGDEEEALQDFDKNTPHLLIPGWLIPDHPMVESVLGEPIEGDTYILRGVSAMGDFLENFGLNALVSQMVTAMDPDASMEATLGEAVQDMPADMINNFASGTSAVIKAPLEILQGVSYFPDVFNPRPEDRDRLFFSSLGISREYLTAKSVLMEDGTSTPNNYLKSMFVGITNSGKNSLNKAHSMVDKYNKSIGGSVGGFSNVSENRNLKHSLQNRDQKAFNQAIETYIKSGKGDEERTFIDFSNLMKRIDPLHGNMSDDDKAAFLETLDGEELERFRTARLYANDLELQGRVWFEEYIREQDPETIAEFELDKAKNIIGMLSPLGRGRQKTRTQQDALEVEQDKAVEEAISLDITQEDVVEALGIVNRDKRRSANFNRGIRGRSKRLE